jgi:signal transduction histidine kinase/CheY-like chemotaxis protein
MTSPDPARCSAGPVAVGTARVRRPLFGKYAALFLGVVASALLASGLTQIWFSHNEHQASLARIHREQAVAGAGQISQFIREIEGHIGWSVVLPWSDGALDQQRLDLRRLLRLVPAITDVSRLDADGREQLRVSRFAMDVIGSQADLSRSPAFEQAIANRTYYGPVYFRRDSEPYMTLGVAGAGRQSGVAVADINLRFIWDVVSRIKVGNGGLAYLIDGSGRLIAHPDISLVLRRTDLSHLTHVRSARADRSAAPVESTAADGRPVLATYASVSPTGWLLVTELPLAEARAPLVQSLKRSALLLGGALALAFGAGLFLARSMVKPIEILGAGAARLGRGDLSHRIAIRTGDELEALGEQFNSMAAQLQDSYATLELKVAERTRQLDAANRAKSRFLAAASHDLRQPLHALGLSIGELQGNLDAPHRGRILERINAAVAGMNELFNALMDVSQLDAGVLKPTLSGFPAAELLARIERTFTAAAREKGLSLRVVSSRSWIRSDPILLERILLNLVSNSIRYTGRGGVVVGCRNRNGMLRIEVWDSGSGIPAAEREHIFGEFYRAPGADRDGGAGLGLGLAIVDRLARLLGHAVDVTSVVGKGSRFAVTVPTATPGRREIPENPPAPEAAAHAQLILVIDDDASAREAMMSLLRSWGFAVIEADAIESIGLTAKDVTPDLVIADLHLGGDRTGIEAIEIARGAFGSSLPACIVTGDGDADRVDRVRALGHPVLQKPVSPTRLRATVAQLMRRRDSVARA